MVDGVAFAVVAIEDGNALDEAASDGGSGGGWADEGKGREDDK
jgi:hypothetical protein